MKALKSNTVKPKSIVDLFKRAGEKRSTEEELDSSGVDSEKSLDIETNDEVYAGHHYSFVLFFFVDSKLVYHQRLVEFSQGCHTCRS